MEEATLSFEWYIPDRVYIVHVTGRVTHKTFNEIADNVLAMLNEPERSKPVHLIFNGRHFYLEVDIPYMHQWSKQIYRHPLTASVLSVSGMNKLYIFIANRIGQVLFRHPQRGQSVQTLNQALLMVRAIDPSLPPFNV